MGKARGGFLRRRRYDEDAGIELRTILKKRKTIEGLKTKAYSMRAQQPPRPVQAKHKIQVWKNANLYLQRYRTKERQMKFLARAKRRIAQPRPEQSKPTMTPICALVIRTAVEDLAPPILVELEKYRLSRPTTAVFMRMDSPTLQQLKLVQSYITISYPAAGDIITLLKERGYCAAKNQSIPISDNVHVEKCLGQYGILCVADIADHLFALGPHFEEVAQFLVPIRLEQPKEGEDKHEGIRRAKLMDRIRVDRKLTQHIAVHMNHAKPLREKKSKKPRRKALPPTQSRVE
jgi:large subunit ribosomal protein L7e